MGASSPFSNWSNFFAAMFAAMSLGFLATSICPGETILTHAACHLRATFR